MSPPTRQQPRWLLGRSAEATGQGAKAVADRALIPRYGGLLFFAVASLGLFFLLALPLPSRLDERGVVATLVAGYAVAAALLMFAKRISTWWIQPVTACGTIFISLGIYFVGDGTSALGILYLWPALFAVYFFTRTQAMVQLVLAALAYGVVLLAMDPTSGSMTRWTVTGSTIIVATALIGTLKGRIERLVERLADAARTDPLTGLLNRRGFEDLFGLEMERARRNDRSLSLLMGDLDRFKDVNDSFGHAAGDSALEQVSAVLKSAKREIDTVARPGGEEFAIIVPDTDERGAYILAERLRNSVAHAFAGEAVPLTISFGVVSFPAHGTTAERLLRAGDRALYAAKALGRDRSVIHSAEIESTLGTGSTRRGDQREERLATVLALAETLDIRDAGTARHSETVAKYAETTARELGLPSAVVERVRLAGILHDVGKIGVSDTVLRKPGPLDEDEWREMRKHPEIGAHILENANLDDIRDWVFSHQERPDGRGYPRGAPAEDIPLEARILAVADAYEAMTSDRVYRAALGPEAARAELLRCAGTQFDAHVVEAFLRSLDRKSAEPDRKRSRELSRDGNRGEAYLHARQES